MTKRVTLRDVAERLGLADSPLTVNELLEVLRDPRFNVRFEALVSIARRGPDDQLLQALTKVLHGADPSLSVVAAWAMGRIGHPRAIEHLRQGLNSRYLSVQAHCARALGTLGDRATAGLLLERLAGERDKGMQIALASALGVLRETAATERLLELLHASEDETMQRELALALARILGDEKFFVQPCRQLDKEPGASLSRAATSLAERLAKAPDSYQGLLEPLNAAAAAFARDDLPSGTTLLGSAIRLLPDGAADGAGRCVLLGCADQMSVIGHGRMEYLILGLHALTFCVPAREGSSPAC
jgi:HEAT repeat protein